MKKNDFKIGKWIGVGIIGTYGKSSLRLQIMRAIYMKCIVPVKTFIYRLSKEYKQVVIQLFMYILCISGFLFILTIISNLIFKR